MGDERKTRKVGELTPFSEYVRELEAGMIDAEATDLMGELVRAVRDTGKKGSISLKIELVPTDRDGDHIHLSVKDLSISKPQPPRDGQLMYSSGDGDLARHNPNQGRLPLTGIEGGVSGAYVDAPKAPGIRGEDRD